MTVDRRQGLARELFGCTLWLLWQCLRLPLLCLLVILEPVVTFLLGSLALLGIVITLFWRLAGVPHFPFALMLSLLLGLGVILITYHSLLHLLAK